MAGKRIPFNKLTSCGNNFLIVDETQLPYLTEREKSEFAIRATNVNYGVGADGIIFLQPFNTRVLADINSYRRYWKHHPVYQGVDYIFRLFEPNGAESFSCGNGLMCVAKYFNHRYANFSMAILTQIPRKHPKAVTIGTMKDRITSWADMGKPHRVPKEIACLSNKASFDHDIDELDNIKVTLREHDLRPFSEKTTLILSGYLVFTGEPHLVIFVETGFSIETISNLLFLSTKLFENTEKKYERRRAFGSWLLHHIGTYLNRQYRDLFPEGINVDFVKLSGEKNIIEYRCFERGINKETLACGTGALAVAFVAKRLKLIAGKKISVWPYRCRWYDGTASIDVEGKETGWIIQGRPQILMQGEYYFPSAAGGELQITDMIGSPYQPGVHLVHNLNCEHAIEY
jgi:diaminopimelate epimerase